MSTGSKRIQDRCYSLMTLCSLMATSDSVSADISVRSPRKLSIFNVWKIIFWVKIFRKYLIYFWEKMTDGDAVCLRNLGFLGSKEVIQYPVLPFSKFNN